MIEKLDLNDGRYVTLINKINEIVDETNSLREMIENHTHQRLTGQTVSPPQFVEIDPKPYHG